MMLRHTLVALAAVWALVALPAEPNASAPLRVSTYDCGDTVDTTLPNPPWVPINGGSDNFRISTEAATCRANNAGAINFSYYDAAFANDQYSQMVIVNSFSGASNIGPAVRLGAGADGYQCRVDGYITRYDDAVDLGGQTILMSGLTNAADGDLLRCEISGTVITRKINGVTQGTCDTASTCADTSVNYSSGKAGIGGQTSLNNTFDDWEGGDLGGGGGGPTILPTLNAPMRGSGLFNFLLTMRYRW